MRASDEIAAGNAGLIKRMLNLLYCCHSERGGIIRMRMIPKSGNLLFRGRAGASFCIDELT
jgi:hypothetical protein